MLLLKWFDLLSVNMKPNPSWQPILKAGQLAESRLVKALLDGTFPINSNLPAERELATLLGVTRPTLREALQRLERDGFIEIRHGKPTRVRDFWIEGNLGVTIALAQYQNPLPKDFIADLLAVRILLAPTYTSTAVSQAPQPLASFLDSGQSLTEDAESYAVYDWELHWQLTIYAENTFFIHFMNSVRGLYQCVGTSYFNHAQTRKQSKDFYRQLQACASEGDAASARALATRVMQESASLWEKIST